MGWIILFVIIALLYSFAVLGHFALKYKNRKDDKAIMEDIKKKEAERIAAIGINTTEEKAPENAGPAGRPKPEYRWEERDGSHYLVYEGRPKPSFSARTWGDIKDSVAEGEAFGIPVRDGSLGYVISGLVAPAAGTLFVFIYGKRGLNPGDEVAMIDPDPKAAGELEIYMEQIRGRERAEDEKRRREERERREKREKEEMARKIMERERRRKLEKEVRQELIDSGELFGDEPKRPPIPREVVDAVYRRDGGRCVYCGSTEDLQIDHIIPFSKGGSSELANLQLLCRKCNIEKSNKIG